MSFDKEVIFYHNKTGKVEATYYYSKGKVNWLLFSKGIGLTWAFGLPIVSTLLIYIVCSYTLHHYVEDFKPIRFFFTTMVVNLFISIPSFTAILLIQHILVESFTRVIIVALSSSIILVVLSYYVLLDKENKKKVKALILNKLKR